MLRYMGLSTQGGFPKPPFDLTAGKNHAPLVSVRVVPERQDRTHNGVGPQRDLFEDG
jgi:hypothetical protein